MYKIQTATEIVNSKPKLLKLYNDIQKLTATTEKSWNNLYKPTIDRYIETIQAIPASRAHHHDYAYGLVEHSLEQCSIALNLYKSKKLPRGASSNEISRDKEKWRYALYIASLLHDAGKSITQTQLEIETKNGLIRWSGLLGSPSKNYCGNIYKMINIEDDFYELHETLPLALVSIVTPRRILSWLTGNMKIVHHLSAILIGDKGNASALGEIVLNADMKSVAINLKNSSPEYDTRISNRISLVEKLMQGLHYNIQNNIFKINCSGGSVFVDENYAYCVSKTTLDAMRQYNLDNNYKSIPNDNIRLMDELLDNNEIVANPLNKKAIWNVTIATDNYSHNLTTIVFDKSKVFECKTTPYLENGTIKLNPSDVATTKQTTKEITKIETKEKVSQLGDKNTSEDETNITNNKKVEKQQIFDFDEYETTPPQTDKNATKDSFEPVPNLNEVADDFDLIEAISSILREVVKKNKQYLGCKQMYLKFNTAKSTIHILDKGVGIVTPKFFEQFLRAGKISDDEIINNLRNLQKKIRRKKVAKGSDETLFLSQKNHKDITQNVFKYKIRDKEVRLSFFIITFEMLFKGENIENIELPPKNKVFVVDK